MFKPQSRDLGPGGVLHIIGLIALLGVPTAAAAQAESASSMRLSLPKIETWQLDNGMQVAFLPVATAPVVSVQVWYHVGAKDEPRNRRGSAHMFEHMMFKGTKRVPPEGHIQHLNRLGGYGNAATTEDATWYLNVVPRDYLDFACQLEAERMRSLLFRESMIATEREVVKEEIRQQENNPLAKGFLRFLDIAYTKHPYAWTAAGTIADLDATAAADLEGFYNTYYVPNNALLVVVGATTTAEVRAAADKWFAPIARGADPPRPAAATPEPRQNGKRREVVDAGQVGVVLAGYHIPAARQRDIYALQVASLILGAGESSRLNERLVQSDKSAVQTGTPVLVREHPGLFVLFAVYLDPKQLSQVEAALFDEMAKIRRQGPEPDELRKAKNQLQAGFAFGLADVAGLGQQIGTSWILTGDPTQWVSDLDKLEAVTAADVKRVAETYLVDNNLTVVVIPPQTAAQ